MAIVKYSEAELEISPKTPDWVKKANEPEADEQNELLANGDEDKNKEVR